MKKLFTNIDNKIFMIGLSVKKTFNKAKDKLLDNNGNWLDESFKYILAVVIGLLFLGGIYALAKDTILPTLTQKIKEGFNFKG